MAFVSILGVWVDGPLDPSVPSNTATQIEWPRGSDGDVEVRLVDNEGQPVDLDVAGADKLELSIRSSLGGDPIKSWAATKAVTPVGLYSFAIASADTLDFFGRLIIDVWATRAGKQRQVVGASYFNSTFRGKAP